MKKDAYYFPHFCNARSDRKIKRLKKDLGIEGYGIYFMTLEVLREQTDFKYPLSDTDLLADEFGTSEAKLQAVIGKYDLFEVDMENNFFSPKLMLYLQPYIEKSDRARIAAQKRWDNVKCKSNANAYANALPEHCESESKCNANQNTSKVKERKGEEIYKSIVEYLNEKTGKQYKYSSTKTKDLINARVNEGFNEEDFKTVIDIKTKEWINNDMSKFLRPETLFSNKFEGYLNQKPKKEVVKAEPKKVEVKIYDSYDEMLKAK